MAQLMRQHGGEYAGVTVHQLHQFVGQHDGSAGQGQCVGPDFAFAKHQVPFGYALRRLGAQGLGKCLPDTGLLLLRQRAGGHKGVVNGFQAAGAQRCIYGVGRHGHNGPRRHGQPPLLKPHQQRHKGHNGCGNPAPALLQYHHRGFAQATGPTPGVPGVAVVALHQATGLELGHAFAVAGALRPLHIAQRGTGCHVVAADVQHTVDNLQPHRVGQCCFAIKVGGAQRGWIVWRGGLHAFGGWLTDRCQNRRSRPRLRPWFGLRRGRWRPPRRRATAWPQPLPPASAGAPWKCWQTASTNPG